MEISGSSEMTEVKMIQKKWNDQHDKDRMKYKTEIKLAMIDIQDIAGATGRTTTSVVRPENQWTSPPGKSTSTANGIVAHMAR